MADKKRTVRIALNPSHMTEYEDIVATARGLRIEIIQTGDDPSAFYAKGHEWPVDAFLQRLAGSGDRARALIRFYDSCDQARARMAREKAEASDRRRLRRRRILAMIGIGRRLEAA